MDFTTSDSQPISLVEFDQHVSYCQLSPTRLSSGFVPSFGLAAKWEMRVEWRAGAYTYGVPTVYQALCWALHIISLNLTINLEDI